MTTWIEPEAVEVPDAFLQAIGGHPLVAELLYRRGVRTLAAARAFLDPALAPAASPYELPEMEIAVARLQQSLKSGERICVWGDFDVDGQTATAVLVSALRKAGGQVIYHIPVRAQESHGVSEQVLTALLADPPDGQPVRLLLTCDTGVGAHAAVAVARQFGVDTLITDHHELPPTLPEALAVITPRRLPGGESHPLSGLPGVGVAYKLIEALYGELGLAQECEQFLDLVALGIVADVAPLTGETRRLLQLGLEVLRRTERLGLRLMCELAEVEVGGITEEHIGFLLAPRLNAVGRLGDANPMVELLTTREESRARPLAVQLEALNAQRQLLTSQVYQGALAQLRSDPFLAEAPAIILAHPSWPAGVIGIVAGRLVEAFHKPAILISMPPGQLARGSARSIEGLDITAALRAQADLFHNFGGHPMAAGFALPPDQIPEFRRRMYRTLSELGLPPEVPVQLDGELPLSELSLELVQDLERLAPFGAGNPPLRLLGRNVQVNQWSRLGRSQEHVLVRLEDETGQVAQSAIWWHGAELLEIEQFPQGPFDLVYTPRTRSWRGQREVQIEWLGVVRRAAPAAELTPTRPAFIILDWRAEENPLEKLKALSEEPGPLQIWQEGAPATQLTEPLLGMARPREALTACRRLVIWTIPPGRAELRAALSRAQAERVVLSAVDPQTDRWEAFINRLAGLVKYALRAHAGQLELERLAGGMAHRRETVCWGVEWLEAAGHLAILSRGEAVWQVHAAAPGASPEADRLAQARAVLQTLLEETAAFRQYYRRAEVNGLLAAGTDGSSQ